MDINNLSDTKIPVDPFKAGAALTKKRASPWLATTAKKAHDGKSAP